MATRFNETGCWHIREVCVLRHSEWLKTVKDCSSVAPKFSGGDQRTLLSCLLQNTTIHSAHDAVFSFTLHTLRWIVHITCATKPAGGKKTILLVGKMQHAQGTFSKHAIHAAKLSVQEYHSYINDA
jgi:hypothetical protein